MKAIQPPLELVDDIERTKSGLYIYTGIPENLEYARRRLMEYWRSVGVGEFLPETPIINMSDHPMCVDRKFLTQDKEKWLSNRKKSK